MPRPITEAEKNAAKFPPTKTIAEHILTNAQDSRQVASIRPFADDCETRPVGYVEGWFVDADMRQQGIGKKLVTAAAKWAVAQGCKEMASDAHLENMVSVKAHLALGFEESSRSVHLRKRLTEARGMTSERNKSPRQLSLLVVDGTFAVCRLDSNVSLA